MFDAKQLNAIMYGDGAVQRAHIKRAHTAIIAAMLEFGITRRKEVAAFLAQVGHESRSLELTREIWQGRPEQGTAAQHRYDVRGDLGNTPQRDGDGFFYRGRGYIQTTGKANFITTGRALCLDLVNHPELLDVPQHAARAAAFFFQMKSGMLRRSCLDLCTGLSGRGDNADLVAFDKITKKVNGGYNGRTDRQARYLRALRVLGSDADFDAQVHLIVARVKLDAQIAADEKNASSVPQTPEKDIARAGADNKNVSQGTPQIEKTDKSDEKTILDEIPVNEQTKAIGSNVVRKVGARLGGHLGNLYLAITEGSTKTKFGVAVIVVVIIVAVVIERKKLKVWAGTAKTAAIKFARRWSKTEGGDAQ